jgi:3-deoxy-D-manno-octulosonic-acid transferase
MRLLYSLLLYLLLPAVLLRLWIKGWRVPAYRRHWGERLGLNTPRCAGAVWVHAVSVGELRAAEPLVRALQARCPERVLLITVTTPAARQTALQLFGKRVLCRYLPYDLPAAVARFLHDVRPALLVVMEVELWPNLYAGLAARRIPVYLVNARLSTRSFRAYCRLGGLMRRTVRSVRHIAAQSDVDQQRFLQLGAHADSVSVAGNLKIDGRLPDDFSARAQTLRGRVHGRHPVWMAASTHPGEEGVVLDVYAQLLGEQPQALLILAPRHPERAEAVGALCRARQLSYGYSSGPPVAGNSVLLVDELGVLVYYYALADVAFVGGSLVDRGGHNPVEALVAGTPVITGPSVDNFAGIYTQLQEAGAAVMVRTAAQLLQHLRTSCNATGERARMVSAGRAVIAQNRGVLERVLAVIDQGCG